MRAYQLPKGGSGIEALTKTERLAVSFLLEEDRARAMSLRWPLVDLRSVLARHVVAGGPTFEAGRLDSWVVWAEATTPLDHRKVSDEISQRRQTPGARLSNGLSDEIHRAGNARKRRDGTTVAPDPGRYAALVTEALRYKASIVDAAIAVLSQFPDSQLRRIHRELEKAAQDVWRNRLHLQASDLVRFGRTNRFWRNSQVEMMDSDAACRNKLMALGNPLAARDLAVNAGTRELAMATVMSLNPLRICINSRRLGHGSDIVALQINGQPCVEAATLKIQKGSFKFGNFSLGPLAADDRTVLGDGLIWDCKVPPPVSVGDTLVVADRTWFDGPPKSAHEIAVSRPKPDTNSAPKAGSCHEGSFDSDPEGHKYCCRSHKNAEAEWSDQLAARRERGELNPEVWPPIVDEDEFDTPADGSPTALTETSDEEETPPAHLTIDDLD